MPRKKYKNYDNYIKVKLKDLIGDNYIFYKKGDSIKEIQKQCGPTSNEFVRKTPTNDEDLKTVTISLKNKPNPIQKLITWVIVKFFGYQYDWDEIREEMKNDGYNSANTPILIQHPNTTTITNKYFKITNLQFVEGARNKKHRLVDGNHRLRLLKELYGGDYEVEVGYSNKNNIKHYLAKMGIVIYDNSQSTVENPEPCFWCSLENIKNYFKTFNVITFIRTIKILTAVIYVVVLNLNSLLLILATLAFYSILVVILKGFNFDPTNIKVNIENLLLKKVIMTILSNVAALSLIIPLIIIMYNMIVEEPINFIIFGFLNWLFDKLEKKYDKKDD